VSVLRSAALAFGAALVAAGSAQAEVAARGAHDGMLALGPQGTPYVAYVRGRTVVVTAREANRWRAQTAYAAAPGWNVQAFDVGRSGPVALVQSADNRSIVLLRRGLLGWRAISIVNRPPAGTLLGWPGLALGARGEIFVAYVRWKPASFATQLILARVDARDRVRRQRITLGGFPPSYVAPPAEPFVLGGRAHVIESYGWRGSVGTLEWIPHRKSWFGIGVDISRGDWPLGPIFARRGPNGRVYAAWTESMLGYGFVPVNLAEHARRGLIVKSQFVLDRALTTSLALPPSGPEIAANEWVDNADLGLDGDAQVWAGVVRNAQRVELDGWIAGLATTRRGERDLLLDGPAGLSWYRSPGRLSTLVTIDADTELEGVRVTGTVSGVSSGRVSLYRERPGSARQQIGSAAIVDGSFSFLDHAPVQPLLYRAVYTDRKSGIPYAALLHPPAGGF
jgi:hypothetical protein